MTDADRKIEIDINNPCIPEWVKQAVLANTFSCILSDYTKIDSKSLVPKELMKYIELHDTDKHVEFFRELDILAFEKMSLEQIKAWMDVCPSHWERAQLRSIFNEKQLAGK